MQSFKNAKFGINHIYAAIILSFIASTVDVIASIFNLKSLDMTLSINMLISTVVTLFTALFPLLSSVLMITGLKVAGKDSKKLKTAFYFSIISIVLTTADFVISTMISYNIVGSPEIAGFILLFVDTGKSIMSILISVMICSGYSDLLKLRNEYKLAISGKTLVVLYSVSLILTLITETVSYLISSKVDFNSFETENNETVMIYAMIILLLLLISLIISVIVYIKYIIFLSKTRTRLI